MDTFYTYKQAQLDRRLWILSEKYHQYYPTTSQSSSTSTSGTTNNNNDDLGSDGEATLNGNDSSTISSLPDIQEELVSALQETRAQMSKIMWFAELNAKGFKKILKKFVFLFFFSSFFFLVIMQAHVLTFFGYSFLDWIKDLDLILRISIGRQR